MGGQQMPLLVVMIIVVLVVIVIIIITTITQIGRFNFFTYHILTKLMCGSAVEQCLHGVQQGH